jgi:type I restriction enzyme S subunit
MTRKMKDSGIEWIGEIPEDWKTKKLKYIGILTANGVDKKIQKDEKLYKSVHYMNVYKNSLKEIGNSDDYLVVSSTNRKADSCLLKKGDVLFTNSSETADDIGHSTVVKEDLQRTLFGYHLMRFRPIHKMNLYYEKYVFGYYYLRKWFEYRSNGITRYGVSYSDFADARIILPPLEQQIPIANYLDNKCTKIDETIEKQKQVVEKLKEYKQSIITEAVTKGLNDNVKMKDSGVEWIGEIPEHWKVKRLKYEFKIKKNIAGKEGYAILSVTQSGIKIKDISNNEGQISRDYSKYQLVEVNDYIMNHMDLLTGFVDCSKYNGVTSPDYRVFYLTNKNRDKDYYKYVFQCCYVNKVFYGLGQGVSGLGRWRLQTDKFLNFNIPVPSNEEQSKIAQYINKKQISIDKAITKKQKLIEKLTEYKKSLIYECVTGKREI